MNCIENYRPVRLLSKISVIFERLVFELIDQNGRHVHTEVLCFESRKKPDHPTDTCPRTVYRGYQKTFDKVSHTILIHKLGKFDFEDSFLALLFSYLIDRYQKFNLSRVLSESLHVLSGVPQGSFPGPLLFLIFMKILRTF